MLAVYAKRNRDTIKDSSSTDRKLIPFGSSWKRTVHSSVMS